MAADYAPLDCAKSHSPAERTICKSYALGQDEARMATLYEIATSLVGMGQRGDIIDQQRTWLRERDACGDRDGCIAAAYAARIRTLGAVISGIASRGPF
jgi:uncharacterized protein